MKFTEKELEKVKKERMEQIDRYLDNEYGVSYTRLEELHDFVVEQDLKHIEEKDKEIERLNNIIKEAINYIDDNTYYKDHKGHINIDDLYIILQKGSDNQ